MIERIRESLAAKGIREYMIREESEERAELYFIRKQLDTKRRARVYSCTVTVYREFEEDGEKYRGNATVTVGDGMSRDELERKLKEAYDAAVYVKNRWYPLPEGGVCRKEDETGLAEDWDRMPMRLAAAAFCADQETDVFINSMEVYARKTEVRLVTSQGIDVSYPRYSLDGEVVAQCLTPQDVETYEAFRYERFDEEAFRKMIRRVLDNTRDRARAKTAAPAGEYRLILSGRQVSSVLEYFQERSHAGMIYTGYSNYKVGDCVQMAGSGEPVLGDKLDMRLIAREPFSKEGIPMKDRDLLTQGVLKTVHGGSRYCYYLGAEPTGDYGKLWVAPGTVPFEEMKEKPYLYVVNFSDFQTDSLSGSFGGEIRLAYLFDGERVTPVTGGSVNGSMVTAQKRMTLSKEMQEETDFCGPFAVCIEGVTVAGTLTVL